jgi:hypothetical protein
MHSSRSHRSAVPPAGQAPALGTLDAKGSAGAGTRAHEVHEVEESDRLIVCSAAIRELQAHQELLDQFGIDGLTKPFDLDTLLGKVVTALTRGSR